MRKRMIMTAALLIAGFGITSAGADSIYFTDTDFPSSAEVVAAPVAGASFGDDANVSLAQTFTVTNAFDAGAIYLAYETDPSGVTNDWSMTVRIFAVADVNAASLVASGGDLYTGTFTFPNNGDTDSLARIELDTPVFLTNSVGTAGYAVEIREAGGADFNPGFEWLRPTSDVYAGGVMYEDGAIKTSGARDLTLAVTSPPEPTANGEEFILPYGVSSTNVVAPGVLFNDVAYDFAVLVTNISSGSLTFNADGSFDCSGLSNGSNTFSYAVVGGSVTSAPATVLLFTTLAADVPVVVDDSYEMDLAFVDEIMGNVLNNDTNLAVTLDLFALAVDSSSAGGVVTLESNGSFTYVPAGNTGTYTFTYRAYTIAATSEVATVTLVVEDNSDRYIGIDDFESYEIGDVRDMPDASANWNPGGSGSIEIHENSDGQYLKVGWDTRYRGAISTTNLFSGIPASSTEYWLYSEIYLTNLEIDGCFGLTANPVHSVASLERGDFDAGVRFAGDGTNITLYAFTGGDASTDVSLGGDYAVNTWLGVWLNINSSASTYDVYIGNAGDVSSIGTQVGTDITFDAGSADLVSLLASSTRAAYIDNIINLSLGTPYEMWISSQGLTSGVNDGYGDDPDGDDMDNLLEYALGGNSMSDDAAVFLPGYEMMADGSTNYLNYVYRRRIDYADRGLTYEVGAGGDLVFEPLTNATEYVDAGAIDADFESVTNRISMDEEEVQFMQLKVSID